MRKRRRSKKRARRRVLTRTLLVASMALFGLAAYLAYLGWSVSREFEQRRWDLPARVYAAPIELYAGRSLSLTDFLEELRRLGYREVPDPGPGGYRREQGRVQVVTRPFEFVDGYQPPLFLDVAFGDGGVRQISDATGHPLSLARLDPLPIGSIFPVHGEDRVILAREEFPPLLVEAIKAVEDRRFDTHHGIDFRAVLRAAFVNLSHGEIRQGGSTLTQQLVRSYFLTNERTFWRKLREAAMAVALELRYDKAELMHAYVNEVYLAQDGSRAIHGFGLASQFYFGKPASELELHETALLVALVRGPGYYDPRRYPQRAQARRNLVLREMAELGTISKETARAAAAKPLGVFPHSERRAGYYAAFMDLVRQQLRDDYPDDMLTRSGLRVYSTLDPIAQSAAERSLIEGIERLEARTGGAPLEGAVVITSPHNGEVIALVGSRESGFDGYNRALQARRPVGSLAKPFVYLAALQSGKYTLASPIDDAPIDVRLPNGQVWSPRNFDGKAGNGPVPLVRALADSLNMATVQLGMAVGVERVVGLLHDIGLEDELRPYPSLLLGAFELTPLQTAQLYNTLANGGFRTPLRAVQAVVDADGALLQRYPLQIEQVVEPQVVYQLNEALVQVLERGTGRSARVRLPPELVAAGKTGTSDGLRDSWFAGFTNDHLAVVWLGADQNESVGLTGASGAATVWADIMAQLSSASYEMARPAHLDPAWIDYRTGVATGERCPDAVRLSLPEHGRPPHRSRCHGERSPLGERIRNWFQALDN